MSTTNNLTLFSTALTQDRSAFRDTGLELAGTDDEGIARIGRALHGMLRVQWWWWGDYLNELFRRELEKNPSKQEAAVSPRLMVRLRCKFLADYCTTTGASYLTLADYMALADFYPPLHRIAELSPSHHHEARLANPTDIKPAVRWLKKARENAWTATELRTQMRNAQVGVATRESREPAPGGIRVAELAALNHWVNVVNTKVERHEVKEDEAAVILHELAPAENLAARLRTLLQADGNRSG